MCGRIPKCVRCGLSHKGAPCEAEACKCANCLGDYPSNFHGSPVFQAAIAKYNAINKRQPAVQAKITPTLPIFNHDDFPVLPTHTASQPPYCFQESLTSYANNPTLFHPFLYRKSRARGTGLL